MEAFFVLPRSEFEDLKIDFCMHNNVLLINPFINPASQKKIITDVIIKTLPTNLGVLAGFLMNAGISRARIIDEQISPVSDGKLKELIFSLEKPRIIGLSSLTINSKRAYELSGLIKKLDPESLVVLGGIHPTVVPEECLAYSGVDIVVRGEGEQTFEELVRFVLQGKDYKKIQGISFQEGGRIIHHSARPIIEDLDAIPQFPYYLFEKDKKRYPSFGSLFISRGCPYGCIFCSSRSISGNKYRYFSIERVISEINLLANKYQQKSIWMMDDNIAADRNHFLQLLDAIIYAKLNKKVFFHGSMRGDNADDEVLGKAKAANFKMISFGLETGKESLMRVIKKGETVKDVVNAIRMAYRKGIAASTTVIFGLPTETRKDRWETIKLVRSLPLSSVRFNTLTPYPGTPAFEDLRRSGRVLIKANWENFSVQYMWEGDDLPYVPDNNNCYELMFDTMFANLSFYLSIHGIRGILRSSFAGGNVIAMNDGPKLLIKKIYKLFLVLIYLIVRFTYIAYKVLLIKAAPSGVKDR